MNVSKGDTIRIYTRSGAPKQERESDGAKIHLAFWGLDEALWEENDWAPVLLHASIWNALTPVDE